MTDAWTLIHRVGGQPAKLAGVAAQLREDAEGNEHERLLLVTAAVAVETAANKMAARIDELNREVYGA